MLDTYGAENEAEFFAVATECFFDCPVELRADHPAMYDLLREYYRQDPAAGCRRHRCKRRPHVLRGSIAAQGFLSRSDDIEPLKVWPKDLGRLQLDLRAMMSRLGSRFRLVAYVTSATNPIARPRIQASACALLQPSLLSRVFALLPQRLDRRGASCAHKNAEQCATRRRSTMSHSGSYRPHQTIVGRRRRPTGTRENFFRVA